MTIPSVTPSPISTVAGKSSVSTTVLAKSLKNFEQSGEGIVKMMELSVNPNIGATIDMTV